MRAGTVPLTPTLSPSGGEGVVLKLKIRRPALAILAIAVLIVGLPVLLPAPGDAQEKKSLDPRLEPLIGTWEGRVQLKSIGKDQDRTLVIEERDGELRAKYGIPGKPVEEVALSIEFFEGSVSRVSFRTDAGNTTLSLMKEGWLSGVFVSARRGPRDPERPIQLLKK